MGRSDHTPQEEPREGTALPAETVAAIEVSREHAADLIAAAKSLSDEFPHLAYHFAVLALEEIGRGVLLVVRDSVGRSDEEARALQDGMEDHVRKLFWALWSPTQAEPVTGAQIDEFRELARQIHEVRKSGLYFDPTAATLPREAVTGDEAASIIKLAESRLGMETRKRWVSAGSQQAEDVRWFGGVTNDAQLREFVFSGASLKKLSELRDVPKWIRWLREQVEEADRQAEEAAARELARTRPTGDEALDEKWRMTFRLFSESHSIRASALNHWNDGNDWLKLRRAKANELIAQLAMPKTVLAAAVWPASYTLAQRLLLALNIGTLGFFWWQPRTQRSRFYEKLHDLETNDEVGIDRSPPLLVEWGSNQVLDERAIRRALLCFAMVPSDPTAPANEALAHYLRGLALIGKTDVHLQFDLNIVEEFLAALRDGMRAYDDWDGADEFAATFETFATRFFTEPDDRTTYVGAVEAAEAGRLDEVKIRFDQAVMFKGLADAYFLETFDRLAEEHAAEEGAREHEE
jgi:AbiV family abortive infection protein